MKRKIIPYNPKLKVYARRNRRNMPLPEVLLWNELKGKQMCGFDFDRQRPIDEFIVDFYCKDLMLVIEVDGLSHEEDGAYEKDQLRQNRLESFGIHFLRFANQEILTSLKFVLTDIEDWIIENRDRFSKEE